MPRSFGIASRSRSCSGSGQNQIASVSNERRRAVERDELDPLLRGDRLALVADDAVGHLDLAEDELEPGPPLLAERAEDRRLRLALRLGVPVAAERLDDGVHRPFVELAHEIGLAGVQVYGARVNRRVGA